MFILTTSFAPSCYVMVYEVSFLAIQILASYAVDFYEKWCCCVKLQRQEKSIVLKNLPFVHLRDVLKGLSQQ